jgi:cysteinyl-tRNA synthetase
MLRTHYRQPIDWTVRALEEAEHILNYWQDVVTSIEAETLYRADPADVVESLLDDLNTAEAVSHLHRLSSNAKTSDAAASRFFSALELIGLVPKLEAYKQLAQEAKDAAIATALKRPEILRTANSAKGFEDLGKQILNTARETASSDLSATEIFKLFSEGIDFERINSLIAARRGARAAKNWAESDRIRDELAAMGIALKDNKDGTTTWEVAR